ncbi:MAG: chain length-determining protein, partial [Ketobacter sp.]|nr:chain length-determining protein [Ketobacter sp.]
MQELFDQISDHLSGIWRYRWIALLGAWLVAIGGWGYVAQLENKYLATARVHVDTNSVLRPLLRGLAIQPDVRQRVALMGKTLLSRPNMEKLIRMVDLDLQVKTDAEKDALLTQLQNTIQLTGTQRNSSIYTLTFVHGDRAIAKRVVQSLISILIEGTLGGKRQDSASATEFLDKQIADYEVRLAEAEGRLADFKRRYVGSMPGDTGGYYQRLEMGQATLRSAQLELREAENRRNELKRQLAGEEPVFIPTETTEIKSVSRLDHRIQNLQEQLDQLLLKYTERHPDVIESLAILADLEEKKKEELAAVEEEHVANPRINVDARPVYQQMRAMLAETEARVAEL